MKALRRIVSRAVGAPKLSEGRCRVVDGILGVCKAAPVAAVNQEDRHRESYE